MQQDIMRDVDRRRLIDMKRKIVIETCEECHYIEATGIGPVVDSMWDYEYSCTNPENGNEPEVVDKNTIPDWCPLEKDGE